MATSNNCCMATTQEGLRQDCCFNVQQSMRTKLDVALHELGMLSTVTNSRQEYLKEIHHVKGRNIKIQGQQLNDSLPRIIQMNSNFITNFAFSPTATVVTTNSSSLEHQLPTSSFMPEGENSLICKVRTPKTRHLYRPYDFPWRPKLIRSLMQKAAEESTLSIAIKDDVAATPPALPIVSRQDSGGNKSNPGSPVKSQKPITGSACSMVRSRSLDDLEISKLSLTECCSNEAGKTEIDTVSQWINNLHVT